MSKEKDDPRTNPEFPYTEEDEHLADVWPEEPEGSYLYVVVWSESRTHAPRHVRCELESAKLTPARKFAKQQSEQANVVGGRVQIISQKKKEEIILNGDGSPEYYDQNMKDATVDVWLSGHRVTEKHAEMQGLSDPLDSPPQNQ